MHQLAELLRLFDAICSRGWQRKGVTGQQIRKQGAALHRELPRPATGLRRAARPGAPAWPAASTATTLFFYQSARRGLLQRRAAKPAALPGRAAGVHRPPLSGLEGVAGRPGAGHFWTKNLQLARSRLLGQGHQPRVAIVEWRYLRLRTKGGDCVIHEYRPTSPRPPPLVWDGKRGFFVWFRTRPVKFARQAREHGSLPTAPSSFDFRPRQAAHPCRVVLYQLASHHAPSRRFGGAKRLVRSLQADGFYRVTKLGKSFFKDRWTDYLAQCR